MKKLLIVATVVAFLAKSEVLTLALICAGVFLFLGVVVQAAPGTGRAEQ